MEFNVVEGEYADLDSIYSAFEEDYLHSDIYANDLRVKYNLTWGEFREIRDTVKKNNGISRRPRVDYRGAKYYYKRHDGTFLIQRRINQRTTYFGVVPNRSVARKVVELCKKAMWDIDVCREICQNWRTYIV